MVKMSKCCDSPKSPFQRLQPLLNRTRLQMLVAEWSELPVPQQTVRVTLFVNIKNTDFEMCVSGSLCPALLNSW